MVLLLQGLTYHCHKRRKTITQGGHWFLLLKEISGAHEEILAAVSGVMDYEQLQLFLQGNVSTRLWHLYPYETSAAVTKGQDKNQEAGKAVGFIFYYIEFVCSGPFRF